MKHIAPILYALLLTCTAVSGQCPWDTDTSIDPPLLNPGGPYILRCLGTPIQINLETDGRTATYSWTGPNGYRSSAEDPADVVTAGTYQLTVNYGGGCSRNLSLDVTDAVPDPPMIDVQGATITCRNPAIRPRVVIDDPLATFRWEGPDGFEPAIVSNPVTRIPGDYTVTITDRNQCNYVLTTTVLIDTVRPSVVVDDQNAGSCTDASFDLSPTSVGIVHQTPSFTWTGPNGFRQAGRDIRVSQTGNYRLTVRDPVNGCRASDLMTIVPHPNQPVVELELADFSCDVREDTMRATVTNCSGCEIEWTLPDGSNLDLSEFTTRDAGTYHFSARDMNSGCVSTASARIIADTTALNRIFRAIPVACNGPGFIRLFLPQNFSEIIWEDSIVGFLSNEDRIALDQPGTIYTTSTDVNGCVQMDTFRLPQREDPIVDIQLSGDTLTCFREPVIVGSLVENYGIGEIAEYNWTFADGSTASGSTTPVTVEGPFTLEVVATNGCSAVVDTFVPIDFRQPEVEARGGFFDCTQSGVQLGVTIPSFTILDVQWTGPRNFWSNRFNPTVITPGIYTIQVTESNGCTNTDTASVSSQLETIEPMQFVAQDIDCISETGELSLLNVDPDISYTWQRVGGSETGSFVGSEATFPDVGIYALQGLHNPTTCLLMDTVTIVRDTMRPSVSLQPLGTIRCATREIEIASSVNTVVLYNWTTVDGEIVSGAQSATARIHNPGEYTLEITDPSNRCSRRESVIIEEEPNPLSEIELSVAGPSCDGDHDGTISVEDVEGGMGPYQYSLGGSLFGSEATFTNLREDTYLVVALDMDGCQVVSLHDLMRFERFEVDLGLDSEIRLGQGITLQADIGLLPEEVIAIRWNFGLDDGCDEDCIERSFTPLESNHYIVEVESALGCRITDTVFVRVMADRGLFIPTAFTPNNDGVNDRLEIFAGPAITSIEAFEVYDRWGKRVFAVTDFLPGDQDASWDGQFGSTGLNPGVYVYVLKATDIRGEVREQMGEITLVR